MTACFYQMPAEHKLEFLPREAFDHCGIVVMFNPQKPVDVALGIEAAKCLENRGPHGAGVLVADNAGEFISVVKEGLITQSFTPDDTEALKTIGSHFLLAQTRYGSNGSWIPENLQPIVTVAANGEQIAVVHNGEFIVSRDLRQKVERLIGSCLSASVSDTFIFTQALAYASGRSWEEKIFSTLQEFKGAYTLGISTKDAVYVIRGSEGIRPLFFGKTQDGSFIFASETTAFEKSGAKIIREVGCGEVFKLYKDGMSILSQGANVGGSLCGMEIVYLQRPEARLPKQDNGNSSPDEWPRIYEVRKEIGRRLATEAPISYASVVVGVPRSGVPYGEGYAEKLGVPYEQLITTRKKNDPRRTFMNDQEMGKIAAMVFDKLYFSPVGWKGAIVVLVDDSMIRSNVARVVTTAARELGATQVHWRIGFPPVRYPCPLGVSIRDKNELIAARMNGDLGKIAHAIGADSVVFVSGKGLKDASVQDGDLCLGCTTGVYPRSLNDLIYQAKVVESSLRST